MILGLSISDFTTLHVLLSLFGIVAGLALIIPFLTGRRAPGLEAAFLFTTIATSVTGFLFPSSAVTPAQIFGVISLVILAVALIALLAFGARGGWRTVYVAMSVAALYLNVFVAIVQAFQKIETLNALAPTQSEPPFFIAQGAALLIFLLIGWRAARQGDKIEL